MPNRLSDSTRTKSNVPKSLRAPQPHPVGVPLDDVSEHRRDEGRVVVAICLECSAELPSADATIRCVCGAHLARSGGELRVVISASDGAISIGAAIGGPAGRR